MTTYIIDDDDDDDNIHDRINFIASPLLCSTAGATASSVFVTTRRDYALETCASCQGSPFAAAPTGTKVSTSGLYRASNETSAFVAGVENFALSVSHGALAKGGYDEDPARYGASANLDGALLDVDGKVLKSFPASSSSSSSSGAADQITVAELLEAAGAPALCATLDACEAEGSDGSRYAGAVLSVEVRYSNRRGLGRSGDDGAEPPFLGPFLAGLGFSDDFGESGALFGLGGDLRYRYRAKLLPAVDPAVRSTFAPVLASSSSVAAPGVAAAAGKARVRTTSYGLTVAFSVTGRVSRVSLSKAWVSVVAALVVFAYLSSAIFGFALRRLVFLCDTNVRNGRFVDLSIGFPEGKRFTSKELSNALSTPVSVS
jgi:hypothetical protein